MHTHEITLTPKAPFDFAKSLRFLSSFPATLNEQTITENRLVKALRIEGQSIVFTLSSTGTVDAPQLALGIVSESALDDTLYDKIIQRVRFFLSMDDNLNPFYEIARTDSDFYQKAVTPLYGYHQVKFLTPFELACWSVLSQRQPMAQSRQMKQRLTEALSPTIQFEGKHYQPFPAVGDFLQADESRLAELVGNERKTGYLLAVIHAFADVDEAFLRDAPYEDVRAWLLAIKGIGEWSATFVLSRGLGRMNQVITSNEQDTFNQSMLRAVKPVYGAIDFATLQQISTRYGEWEGYWAHYLKANSD